MLVYLSVQRSEYNCFVSLEHDFSRVTKYKCNFERALCVGKLLCYYGSTIRPEQKEQDKSVRCICSYKTQMEIEWIWCP